MRGRLRHIFVWKTLRFLFAPLLKRKFRFEPEIARVSGPCLILSNHTTNWDPLLLALSFKEQVYFVASEHVFRFGFASRLIRFLQSPVARLKSSVGAGTAAAVMRRLREGCNVCIFVEGDRSWDGRTGLINPATAKLARVCGANVVTYKFIGGYFTWPRWAAKLRRGKMYGEIKGVYSPEDIRGMPAERIDQIIREDLSEDAYERQRGNPVAFKGKNLAEHLETALFMCPGCGKTGTPAGRGNVFACACGLSAVLDSFGFLTGSGFPFDNVAEWNDWQLDRLRRLPDLSGDDPVFEDAGVALKEILPGFKTAVIGTGDLCIRKDRLICAGESFPLASVNNMAIHGRNTVEFCVGSRNFEICGGKTFCGRKYLLMYNCLKQYSDAEMQ